MRHFIEREYRDDGNMFVAVCTCERQFGGGSRKLARQGYHDHLDAMAGVVTVRTTTRADRALREAAEGMRLDWTGSDDGIPKGWTRVTGDHADIRPGTMARDGRDVGED